MAEVSTLVVLEQKSVAWTVRRQQRFAHAYGNGKKASTEGNLEPGPDSKIRVNGSQLFAKQTELVSSRSFNERMTTLYSWWQRAHEHFT